MIEVNNLTKLYWNGKGVRDLVFTIKEGEVFGYLGPNAAGKTTTIRNLLGFLKPDIGSCTIMGRDCWKEAHIIQKILGYIPGEIIFLQGYKGIDFLNLIADMRKMKDRKRMKGLLERFQLDPHMNIKNMSRGMKQKLGIVTACMHDPCVMVFDEPSAGLDPLMRNVFNEFIAEEKKAGKTIFMSSHSFEEIDRTCDRAGIIREGVLIDVRDIHVLKEEQRKAFIVSLKTQGDAEKLMKSEFDTSPIDTLRIEVIVKGNVDRFIKFLSGLTVENLDMHYMSLEDVFMQYYGKETQK